LKKRKSGVSSERHMTTTSRGCSAGYDCQLLRRMSLLMAQSGHHNSSEECPLLGVKRTGVPTWSFSPKTN
jgi:hypothetical protein